MPKNNSGLSKRSGPVAPVVLAILDGWGYSDKTADNAIRSADTPIMDALWEAYPHTLIEASGADVGLPDNQMGNSEVGHLTIGAGRIIQQELVRITNAVEEGSLGDNQALIRIAEKLKHTGGTLHLLGLCSDGGVHSHINHLSGLLEWASSLDLKKVAIHAITDGRDTPTKSAGNYLQLIEEALKKTGTGEIASLCGRYWAMDRDHRWDRTAKAYNLLTNPSAPIDQRSTKDVLEENYQAGTTDEFLNPSKLSKSHLADGDGLIIFNFRPDRSRQLVQALTLKEFTKFERKVQPKIDIVTFTQYEAELDVDVVFPPDPLEDLLGNVVSEHGLNQYRTAETEKYPHVTYFLNGGIEKPLAGEERHLVPSPRVATYDLSPAMSAEELTNSCKAAIESGRYSLIVINYANPDMVGHTGLMEATKKAISTVDKCIGRLLDSTGKMSGSLLITADHGNAELMKGVDGQAWTAHTTNPVPVILVEGEKRKVAGQGNSIKLRTGGGLADIAPTILQLLNLPKPKVMTGESLISYSQSHALNPKIVQPV